MRRAGRALVLACTAVVLLTACGRVGPPVRSHERERRSRAVPTQPAPEAADEDSEEERP